MRIIFTLAAENQLMRVSIETAYPRALSAARMLMGMTSNTLPLLQHGAVPCAVRS